MPASNSPGDPALACAVVWQLRAERARRLAIMLSLRDAAAIEAYAKECEARARQAIEKSWAEGLPPLAA